MYKQTYLTEIEQRKLDEFDKVIVWGFPLDTHTHSYIHAMWVKVFKEAFGKSTFWFHDDDYPTDFDYNNCLFITEGYADYKIPIIETSTYFVLNAIVPEKYLDKKTRLIEIRFNVMEMHDCNNDFNLNDGTHGSIIHLSQETKYEKLTSNKDLHVSKRGHDVRDMNYECVYLYWATDLLPHEFNFDDINIPKENVIYYIGSPTVNSNYDCFKNICQQNNLQWISINPWENPVSFEEKKKLMQKSYLCPDFRPKGTQKDVEEFGIKNGKNHLEIGYLPCRVLKAISYGQLGITDSEKVKGILGDHVIYHENIEELFKIAVQERQNTEKIKQAMIYIQNHHTYVQRARDLIRALLN